jgi:hypothetical protein
MAVLPYKTFVTKGSWSVLVCYLEGLSASLREPKSVWGVPRNFPGSQRKISGMSP